MASTGSPFTTNPQLTGVVIAYRNAELIADRVLPRIGPAVPNKEFRYLKYDFAQNITLPDARVGRKGTPNQVEFMATETRAVTADYGLTDIVPNDDIKQAPPGYDPLANAAEKTMNLVDMIRGNDLDPLANRGRNLFDVLFIVLRNYHLSDSAAVSCQDLLL